MFQVHSHHEPHLLSFIAGYPTQISIATLNTKANIRRKGFLAYRSQSITKNSGQEPEDRNCSRDHGKLLLTGLVIAACSAWFLIHSWACPMGIAACSVWFLIHSWTCPMGDTPHTHSRLGPPTSITNQQNVLQVRTNLIGAFNPIEIPSSQVYLGLCQIDKNNQNPPLYMTQYQFGDHQVNPSKWRNRALIILWNVLSRLLQSAQKLRMSPCISYFSIVVIRHHDQGNLLKSLIWAYGFRVTALDSKAEVAYSCSKL